MQFKSLTAERLLELEQLYIKEILGKEHKANGPKHEILQSLYRDAISGTSESVVLDLSVSKTKSEPQVVVSGTAKKETAEQAEKKLLEQQFYVLIDTILASIPAAKSAPVTDPKKILPEATPAKLEVNVRESETVVTPASTLTPGTDIKKQDLHELYATHVRDFIAGLEDAQVIKLNKKERQKLQERYQFKADKPTGYFYPELAELKQARILYAAKDLDEVSKLAKREDSIAMNALRARINDGSNAACVNMAKILIEAALSDAKLDDKKEKDQQIKQNYKNEARNLLKSVLKADLKQSLKELKIDGHRVTPIQIIALINWISLEVHTREISVSEAFAMTDLLNKGVKEDTEVSKEFKQKVANFLRTLHTIDMENTRQKAKAATAVKSLQPIQVEIKADSEDTGVSSGSGLSEVSSLAASSSLTSKATTATSAVSRQDDDTDKSLIFEELSFDEKAVDERVKAAKSESLPLAKDQGKEVYSSDVEDLIAENLSELEMIQRDEVDGDVIYRSKLVIILGFVLGITLLVGALATVAAILIATQGIALASIPLVGATLAGWPVAVALFTWLSVQGATITSLSSAAAIVTYVVAGTAATLGLMGIGAAMAEAISPGLVSGIFGNVPKPISSKEISIPVKLVAKDAEVKAKKEEDEEDNADLKKEELAAEEARLADLIRAKEQEKEARQVPAATEPLMEGLRKIKAGLKADAERLAKEKQDRETREAAERTAKETAEREAAAKAEQNRLAKEAAELEVAAKAEQNRLAKETIIPETREQQEATAKAARAERLAKEEQELEALAADLAKEEAEAKAKKAADEVEKSKAEHDRVEKELEAEEARLAKEQETVEAELAVLAKEQAERKAIEVKAKNVDPLAGIPVATPVEDEQAVQQRKLEEEAKAKGTTVSYLAALTSAKSTTGTAPQRRNSLESASTAALIAKGSPVVSATAKGTGADSGVATGTISKPGHIKQPSI